MAYLANDGTLSAVSTTVSNGFAAFKTNNFGTWAVLESKGNSGSSSDTSSDTSSDSSSGTTSKPSDENPATGENGTANLLIIVLNTAFFALLAAALVLKKRQKYEV